MSSHAKMTARSESLSPIRIAFVGDSFVNGTGDPECLGWVGRVCRSAAARGHGVTLYNLGIRRDTSVDVAARWKEEVGRRLVPKERSGIVFSFGVNDCVMENGRPRVDPAATLQNARRVLTDASNIAPCLMIGPPPIDDDGVNRRLDALTPRLADMCRDLAVPFLDTLSPLRRSAVWRAEVARGDGAHPADGGYDDLARLIDEWRAWRPWLP